MSAQFLLAEYAALQARANHYEEVKSKQVNFFLVVAASAGAVASAIIKEKLFPNHMYEAIMGLSVFTLILGILTLRMLITYSIAVVAFYRRAGRVRRWFVDRDNALQKYVAFESNDDRPTFTNVAGYTYWRGAESILLLLNSIATISIALSILYQCTSNTCLVVLTVLVFGIMSWYLQVSYTQKKLKKTEMSEWGVKNINFPTVENEK
ncbi:MAG: hypothetical protein D3906_15845 [Candidatus Electrothrix sp. AUS1_2]|nr:hypothetical protein [Candidatus Electrothrix sp. AUS1_2]